MNWTDLIKQARLNRGLNQADLAELCGVKQAAVSRWESGKHVPDRATRNRLRAILHAQDSKADQAILRSVRYAHTCSDLSVIEPQRMIETSLGACRSHRASRAEILRIPRLDWFMHFNPSAEAGLANAKALKNGDVVAFHFTMEGWIVGTGEQVPVMMTHTPLWFSDGTFVIRSDWSILPIGEYHGQFVTAITSDDIAIDT